MYGLEACPLKKSDIRSLDFVVDRFFMKLFNTNNIPGAPIKNNPLEKILYLRNCSRFFHQIYTVYRGGFRPCIQQIAFKYLV